MQKQSKTSLYHLLILLSRSVEAELMQKLSTHYSGLKMSYAAPMMQISLAPMRLNDLAQAMGISKQLCNQNLKPIEALGLIQRIDDHADGRAKLIQLSPQGKALTEQAFAEIIRIQNQFEARIAKKELADISHSMNILAKQLNLLNSQSPLIPLASLLGIVSRYSEKHLMELTIAQGFDGLQMSYSQVLSHLASKSHGVTVSYLAKKNNISSQAISKIVNELEKHGYITKQTDGKDKRSKSLSLSSKGLLLIKASLKASKQLDSEIIAIIGKQQFQQLQQQLELLQIEKNTTSSSDNTDKSAVLVHYIQAYASNNNGGKKAALGEYLSTSDVDTLNQILNRLLNKP